MNNLQRPDFQVVTWSLSTAQATLTAMKAVATLQGTRPLYAISCKRLEATRDWMFKAHAIVMDDLVLLSPTEFAQQVHQINLKMHITPPGCHRPPYQGGLQGVLDMCSESVVCYVHFYPASGRIRFAALAFLPKSQ